MNHKKNLGCKYGMPHDMTIIFEDKTAKWEQCKICNKKMRWNKTKMGRIDNVRYLEAHVRNFAQKNGATKRIYYKMYDKNKSKIIL